MNSLQNYSDLSPMSQNFVIDEIEGLEEDEIQSGGWGGDFPLDATHFRTVHRSVREIVDRINSGRFKIDPDFQRALVWQKYKQSKLIESCIMRIPLPVFYVAESTSGYLIVDGLQRLSTFRDFLNNKFKLRFRSNDSGTSRNLLAGKRFEELSIRYQERIEDTPLVFYAIDEQAPYSAKFDIFERVNSGVPLTRQQMRNALFCGTTTNWLKSIVETPEFLSATGKSLNSQRMRDREAVNRFVSFKLIGWENYKGDMDGFLADGLNILSSFGESELQNLKENFISTMKFCEDVFGKHTFRKSIFTEDKNKTLINMSLFDVMSVTFSNNLDGLPGSEYKKIKKYIKNLKNLDRFEESIIKGTNSKKSVEFRYRAFERVFSQLVSD